MTDPQAVWNSVVAHLQALFYVIQVHGHEVFAWLAPPVHAAIAWIDSQLQAAIAWAGPVVRSATDAAQPYGATALAFLVAYWREAAIVAGPAIVVIALAVWMRRRRRVKATLFDVSLDHDPKTEWLKLNIVMRNFQSHALIVRSLMRRTARRCQSLRTLEGVAAVRRRGQVHRARARLDQRG